MIHRFSWTLILCALGGCYNPSKTLALFREGSVTSAELEAELTSGAAAGADRRRALQRIGLRKILHHEARDAEFTKTAAFQRAWEEEGPSLRVEATLREVFRRNRPKEVRIFRTSELVLLPPIGPRSPAALNRETQTRYAALQSLAADLAAKMKPESAGGRLRIFSKALEAQGSRLVPSYFSAGDTGYHLAGESRALDWQIGSAVVGELRGPFAVHARAGALALYLLTDVRVVASVDVEDVVVAEMKGGAAPGLENVRLQQARDRGRQLSGRLQQEPGRYWAAMRLWDLLGTTGKLKPHSGLGVAPSPGFPDLEAYRAIEDVLKKAHPDEYAAAMVDAEVRFAAARYFDTLVKKETPLVAEKEVDARVERLRSDQRRRLLEPASAVGGESRAVGPPETGAALRARLRREMQTRSQEATRGRLKSALLGKHQFRVVSEQ